MNNLIFSNLTYNVKLNNNLNIKFIYIFRDTDKKMKEEEKK